MNLEKTSKAVLYTLAVWMIIAIFGAMLFGCTRTVYVPTESIRTEYKDREVEKIITDTVKDTHYIYVKGDTVYNWRDRVSIKTESVHDTCFIERVDSVQVPYPVEKPLTRWQQVKQDIGGMALGVLCLVLCAIVFWLINKFRK